MGSENWYAQEVPMGSKNRWVRNGAGNIRVGGQKVEYLEMKFFIANTACLSSLYR